MTCEFHFCILVVPAEQMLEEMQQSLRGSQSFLASHDMEEVIDQLEREANSVDALPKDKPDPER